MFTLQSNLTAGTRGGLMLSVLTADRFCCAGLEIEWYKFQPSAGWGTGLCSWARHFTRKMLFSANVYQWVLSNLKGQCHENHFKNLRVQKHINCSGNLQEVVHFCENNNANECNQAEKK